MCIRDRGDLGHGGEGQRLAGDGQRDAVKRVHEEVLVRQRAVSLPPRRNRCAAAQGTDASCVTAWMCQTAMNRAAMVGPITKPLMPKTARPPSVVNITT